MTLRRPRVRTRPGAAALGLALDALVGDPANRWHPVARFGHVMDRLESRLWAADETAAARGALYTAAGTALGVGAGSALRSTSAATTVAAGGQSLRKSALAVAGAVDRGDLARARALLPALVGRDPTDLDEHGVCRAVVESVADNTVDAVVAPALWGAVGGAPAVLGHRAVNTMDAMVGHRSERYAAFGTASARLDDAAAFLPARVTVGLVGLVRPTRWPEVWRSVRHDAPDHPSPNAGVAEAAWAGALGVRLGGPTRYRHGGVECRPWLGVGPPPLPRDVRRAVRLLADVEAALVVLLLSAAAWRRRRRRRRSPSPP